MTASTASSSNPVVHAVSAPRVLVGEEFVGPATIRVDTGVVREVVPGLVDPAEGIRLHDGFLTAGLIDLQVNGWHGVDFAEASPRDWRTVSQRLPSAGVTAYAPTFITAAVRQLADSLDRTFDARQAQESAQSPLGGHGEPGEHGLADGGPAGQARILGAHLEGPFISRLRAGAHNRSLMVDPGPAELAELLGSAQRRAALLIVTLAPERDGALDAIAALASAGVLVSLGHTDVDGHRAAVAADAGARMVTHLFNAMPGLDHRSPSLVGWALSDPRMYLGLIADLQHTHPDVVRLVLRAAPERVVLVTDAVAAAGLPPGQYRLGGGQVTTTRDDPLPRRPDGVLAGSVLHLDQAIRNVVGLGVPVEHAMLAATRNPADAVGRADLGRLAPGSKADLVWWSDEMEVRQVWVGGRACLPAPTG